MPCYEVQTVKIFVEADDEEKAKKILIDLIKFNDESIHVMTNDLGIEDVEDVLTELDVEEAEHRWNDN